MIEEKEEEEDVFIDHEYSNGQRSAFHRLYKPLNEYIADIESLWNQNKANRFTPVRLYEHPFRKILWEKK